MRIVRGRYKGREGTVHQYANDWMVLTVQLQTGPKPVTVSPAHVRVDPADRAIFDNYALNGAAAVGRFWEMWRLDGDAFVPVLESPGRVRKPVRQPGRAPRRIRTAAR